MKYISHVQRRECKITDSTKSNGNNDIHPPWPDYRAANIQIQIAWFAGHAAQLTLVFSAAGWSNILFILPEYHAIEA